MILSPDSLGAGILVDAMNHNHMVAYDVILVSPFSSIRDVAVHSGSVPRLFSFIVPDAYDNVTGVKSLKLPIHIVHSETDGRFPVWMPQKISGTNSNSEVTIVPTPTHSDFLKGRDKLATSGDQLWSAVLAPMTSN